MSRPDNYALTAAFARQRFLTYDQDTIIAKCSIDADGEYLYLPVLSRLHRVSRATGNIECRDGEAWRSADDFSTTLTIFDYLCDSRPLRCLSGREKIMSSFGRLFHSSLQDTVTELDKAIDRAPDAFARACLAMGGAAVSGGDLGFRLMLFPELPVTLRFWHSDEDFPPSLRFFWDENTEAYIRYETMHYALGLIRARLTELLPN